MVQLTIEQRAYLIKNFYETRSLQITCESFRERFPERQASALKTNWANVRKFEAHGTCLNRNKGNSGGRRTGRSERNIEAVRQRLAEIPRATSGIGLPSATFNHITRLDLMMHPYRMPIRHGLLPRDFDRRMRICVLRDG